MRHMILCCLIVGLLVANSLHAQPDSLWSRTFGGGSSDHCYSLIQTEDGGYALAGMTYSFGAGIKDFWLVRTDENGDSLWSRTFGGRDWDECYSLVQTADGGFALAGYTMSFGAGTWDFWLVRTDSSGDSLWSRTYGGEDLEICNAILQTEDGGFILAGTSQTFGMKFWMLKTDENGDSLWSRAYGGDDYNECYSIIQTGDGGYALAGFTTSLEEINYDFWIVRTDENGDSLWSRSFGGRYTDECHSIIQTEDGGFALAGSSGGRFWLVRTDEHGDSLWSRTYVRRDYSWCYSLVQTANGGFALAGYSNSFDSGVTDFWLVKLGPDNSVPDDDVIVPHHFGLNTIFPNPFNSRSVASYSLRIASWVNLRVYDLDGRLMQTMVEGWQTAGSHQVVIDGAHLPSGVYLLRLTDGRQVALGKACLVR